MRALLAVLFSLVVCGSVAVAADEQGPVAQYSFDEGSGTVAHDGSGNGNDGTILGAAKWVPCGNGFALEFNGKDSCVDCGKGPSLDITDVITVEAWVRLAAEPTVPSEWVMVGKQQDVYALCYYLNGQLWWYISGGDNPCAVVMSFGQWHHVAGTFDGKNMMLYVDGESKYVKESKYPTITSRKDLSLVIGPPPFSGMMDDVRIYHRALSAEEIGKHYQTEKAAKLALPVSATKAP